MVRYWMHAWMLNTYVLLTRVIPNTCNSSFTVDNVSKSVLYLKKHVLSARSRVTSPGIDAEKKALPRTSVGSVQVVQEARSSGRITGDLAAIGIPVIGTAASDRAQHRALKLIRFERAFKRHP